MKGESGKGSGPEDLVVLSDLLLDLDADRFTLPRVTHALVLKLHGVDGLGKIRVFALDVNNVADVEFPTGKLNDPHAEVGKVVGNPADQFLTCLRSHSGTSFQRKRKPGWDDPVRANIE